MRWAPYVPVAQRRAQAAQKMQKLKKQGQSIQPIEIEGRTIARTFWGKGWCDHMESFCDHDNRLPRGRTYVRNGSVCHLEINEGHVNAMVSGSSIYHIKISIKLLASEKWQALKNTCTGKIGSLLDLLSGTLSIGVMDVVCHPDRGLFPLARDLAFSCDCPDSAAMCKHIAATLYGVGSRLDAEPVQLFKLRGVNFEELIDVKQAVLEVTTAGKSRRKRLEETALSDLFHLEIVDQPKSEATLVEFNPLDVFPDRLTGYALQMKRTQLKLTKNEFARRVGVSMTSITLWEAKGEHLIKPNASSINKLKVVWSSEPSGF